MAGKKKTVRSEEMIKYIIEHSFDDHSIKFFQRILSGEADRQREYTYTGAFKQAILDGDFKTAIRFADKSNIMAFVALLAEGDYDISLHRLLNARMYMLKMPGATFHLN